MNVSKYLLSLAVAAFCFATLSAENPHAYDSNDYSTTEEERETDIRALREFVKSKAGVSVAEKGGNLMIGGDVRAEWRHLRARTHGHNERGKKSDHLRPSETGETARWYDSNGHRKETRTAPVQTNEFDVEANLVFDYRAEKTWAKIQLQMSNPAGIRQRGDREKHEYSNHRSTMFGSGKLNNLALRKAYMGLNCFERAAQRFDVEVGRRRLKDVFDSQVEFHNLFDGLLLRYGYTWEGITDFGIKLAAFVVDQRVNHFGYVGEADFLNIADWGVDFKYSYIHWDKHGVNRYDHHHPLGNRFDISQFLLVYNFAEDCLPVKSQVYGAYLHNHVAPRIHRTHHRKSDDAWYVGCKMGEVRKEGDWALDINYQWVQAQAIPESDVSGIGRDTPRDISFYRKASQGFANYKGWMVEGLYALTNNITLDAEFERVRQQDHRIGGHHKSWQFKLAAIYAF